MINYSIVMRSNPTAPDEPKKAYGSAQYSQIMTLEKFAQHIASHGCVYSRADIQAVLTLAVDCMRELLLAGQRIQLGDLGIFAVTINSKGAESANEFTSNNIKKVNVSWLRGERFQNLRADAEFNLVPTRKAAAAVVKALKAGETVVNLADGDGDGDSDEDEDEGVKE